MSKDRIVLFACIIGSFVGTWHALPMLNVIGDEMYYVGGVLRAFEARALLPLPGEVPYGILTYYLNYLAQIPVVFLSLVLFGFHVDALKSFLLLHPEVSYIVPRLLNASLAAFSLWMYDRFLKKLGLPLLHRFAAISAIFLTVLPATIFHTGKMWVLSFLLFGGSMVCVHQCISSHRSGDTSATIRSLYAALLLAAGAAANFFFAGMAYLAVPLFYFSFKKDRALLFELVKASLASVLLFLFLTSINWQSHLSLIQNTFTGYHPLQENTLVLKIGLVDSLVLHGKQLLSSYPLVLLLVVISAIVGGIRHKLLFWLSALYGIVYFAILSSLAMWYTNESLFLRYLFPFGFFFSGMVAALGYQKNRLFFIVFSVIQCVVYVYLLFLLSIPTTFNQMHAYVSEDLRARPALVYNDADRLDLPVNKKSAELTRDTYCATRCQFARSGAMHDDLLPVALNFQTDLDRVPFGAYTENYWISEAPLRATCGEALVASFLSGAEDQEHISVEHNLGNYLLGDFWKLSRLGKNLYLYKISSSCLQELLLSGIALRTDE